jgi:hypothetical protein
LGFGDFLVTSVVVGREHSLFFHCHLENNEKKKPSQVINPAGLQFFSTWI